MSENLTYEQALLKVTHLEIEGGTKRSVMALYTLMLPFMLAWQRENDTALLLPDEYVEMHKAICARWPGSDDGIRALSWIKKQAWENYEAIARSGSSDNRASKEGAE